jgi:hypothetical protein
MAPVSAVQLGYYMTEQGATTYHLTRPGRAGQRLRPLCGAARRLDQWMGWGWTRQVLSVEKARERAQLQERRLCRRCDQLAEALRDPITRMGELADG